MIYDFMIRGKVAAAVFVNEKDELLLYLRDNKSSIPYPNFWALLGGHVEENESLLDALKREIKEEIEYEFEEKPIFLGTLDDNVGNDVYVYRIKINKKINELKLNEGQILGFFDFEDVLKLKIPSVLKKFILEKKEKILKKC